MGFFDDPANQPPATPPNTSSYAGVPKNLSDYLGQGGTLLDPWTQPVPQSPSFTAPTEAEALASPGMKYALAEALRTGQASAAAKGTLLNGRVLQGLEQNAIGTALQGYGDLWNREFTANKDQYGRTLGEYLLGRENFQMNQDRPYDKLYRTSQLGKPTS